MSTLETEQGSLPEVTPDTQGQQQAGDAGGTPGGMAAPMELPPLEISPRWPKYAQEGLKNLLAHPDGRQFAEHWVKHGREADASFTKVAQERAALRDQYRPISELLEPYTQQWAMAGMDTQSGLRQMLATADYIAKNPVEGIKQLAGIYGVDLASLVAEQPYVPPEVAELREWKRKMEQQQFLSSRQQQQQQQQSVLEQLRAFEAATDDNGNPKYPHYGRVQEAMVRAFRGGFASDLDSAYQFAIHNDRELAAEIAAESARKEAARKAAEAQKAAEASRTVRGKSTAGAPPTRSFADDIRAGLAKQLA